MNNTAIVRPIHSKNWVVFAENNVRILNCELQGVCWFGLYSYINHGLIRSHSEVGRFCSIGRNVSIGLGIHDYGNFSTHPIFASGERLQSYFINESRRVIIGNDVWVGDRVLINSGIVVGDGSVIAAGSVVTKDVPPYAIVGGTPARLIKYRFPESVIERLINLKWWSYSLDKIHLCKHKNIDIFIGRMQAIGMPDNDKIIYQKFSSDR